MFAAVIAVILSLVISILLLNLNVITFGLAVVLIFSVVLIVKPGLYFEIFLVLRPLIDITSDYKLPGGVNLAAIFTLALVGICGLLLFRKENLKKIKNNKFLSVFNKLFALFLLFSLFSLLNTRVLAYSLTDFLRLLSIQVAVNYAVLYFSEEKSLPRLLKLMVLSSLVPLCLGLYQFVFKRGMAELGFNRLFGTFLHPNVFAQFLVLVFLILFYIALNYKMRAWHKFCIFLLLAAALLELFLTYTRGAWIALALSLALYTLVRTKPLQRIKFIALGIMILILLLPYIQKRFSDVNEDKYYQLSSWQWRLQQWTETLSSLKEHAFIGNGMGMYERTYGIMAHNDYLRIAFETGFLGLFFYVLVLFYILFLSFKKLWKAKSYPEINRSKIALVFALSLIVMSMVDNLARSTVILLYFFVIMGSFLSYESITGQ